MGTIENDEMGKNTLKRLVFCAFLMSGIDGYMDEEEIDVIRVFTNKYWKKEYGDTNTFFKEIDKEVADFFIPDKGKFELRETFIKEIVSQLSADEEYILLDFM
ncbi:MAG: hypothetical protein GY866_28100, partial [Proteobacteria bacterium]|nr:hypothetical protein [Pseudomonadota bacterium]